jgi:hypothetical protein
MTETPPEKIVPEEPAPYQVGPPAVDEDRATHWAVYDQTLLMYVTGANYSTEKQAAKDARVKGNPDRYILRRV